MNKTVYVCPIRGDDANDGLSEDTPVKTLARGREIAVKTNAQDVQAWRNGSWLTEEIAKE